MSKDSKLAGKIKWQIARFSGRLSEGLAKPLRRFIGDMIYGIQASRDVKLSNIARALQEEIKLIKTENRLSRNLAAMDLTEELNRRLCWEGSGLIQDDSVLAVDLSDIRKEYAKKLEYLAEVRDGSTGEIANGFWLCEIIGADVHGDKIVPLYGELYSHTADDFVSENTQLLKAIDLVTGMTGGRGIIAIDRGGDRYKILKPLLQRELRFVIRQKGDRHVILPGGRTVRLRNAVRWCKTTLRYNVVVERGGYKEEKQLGLGCLPVRLPKVPDEPLWLVVIRGFGEQPILLLTNVQPEEGREYPKRIAEIYLTRWKCDESYRFMKQAYNLEDVRVRRYVSLRNTYVLLHSIVYFVSVVIGAKTRLNLLFKKICERAQRLFEIAPFFHYAVAEGIHRILFASSPRPATKEPQQHHNQLRFAFARPPN